MIGPCCAVQYLVFFLVTSVAIDRLGKRELIATVLLSSWCQVGVSVLTLPHDACVLVCIL